MLEIRTSQDILKLDGLTNETVKIIGTVEVPLFFYPKNLRSVRIEGGTLTGFPLFLTDCKDLYIKDVGFRQKRPVLNRPYESWWGLRLYSTVEFGCENVTLDSCSVSGNTDEFAIHPNIDVGSGWDINKWAGRNLKIFNCLVGPSLINLTRGNHNFGISIGRWDRVLLEKNVFFGHNRRCPQIQGNAEIIGCAIYGYGSMGVGLHCGTSLKVQDLYCRYNRALGQGASKLISGVGGSLSSVYGKMGQCSIEFSNLVDYTSRRTGRQTINMTDNVAGAPIPTTYKALAKPIKYTEAQILNGIGCRDNFDRTVLQRISRGDFKWIRDT